MSPTTRLNCLVPFGVNPSAMRSGATSRRNCFVTDGLDTGYVRSSPTEESATKKVGLSRCLYSRWFCCHSGQSYAKAPVRTQGICYFALFCRIRRLTSRKRCRRCRLAPCIFAAAVQDAVALIEGSQPPEPTMQNLNRFCSAETMALTMMPVLLVNDAWRKSFSHTSGMRT